LNLSDFNFVRQGDECIAVGPEPVPAGVCATDDPNRVYQGSSGWRKVPGNTCVGGVTKDEKVDKKCSMGGFDVYIQFLNANMDMISSTTGRKRGSSDSRVFNVFFILSE
jgi:hypothetical protein